MSLTPQQLAQKVSSVPSLPAIFSHLTAVINDPRSSVRDIESVVNDDPALAGRLLRLANSAYFGFPARVDTLTRAITLVGSRQLHDMALATSVLDSFRHVSPEFVNMESFWRHSVACGLVSRILAGWRREPNVEQYFVAGLLHDIGRLVLFLKSSDEMSRALDLAQSSRKLLYHCEQEILGFDHAAVGGALLKGWNLPPHISAAVEYHHAPHRAGANKSTAAIVHIADFIVNGVACGNSGERYVPPLDPEAWNVVELSPGILAPTLKLLNQQLSDTLSTLLDTKQ